MIVQKTKAHYTLKDWERTWISKLDNDCIFISALNKENMEEFKRIVFDKVKEIHITRFPYNDFLYQEYE